MTEYPGRGDARRSMALLWGKAEPPKRGPKQGLSVEAIVGAAIAIADADGLDALSMRKVGERLGTSAMALYTYVPAKTELVDLMLEAVLGELPWRAVMLELCCRCATRPGQGNGVGRHEAAAARVATPASSCAFRQYTHLKAQEDPRGSQ